MANLDEAQILFNNRKYQDTIDTCIKILEIENNSIEAIKLIAKSYLLIKKIDESRLYLKRAQSLNPSDFEVIKDLGNTFYAVGDLNNAKEYYQKALGIESNYAPALANLGSVLIKLGKKKEALPLLIKSTKYEPKFVLIFFNPDISSIL